MEDKVNGNPWGLPADEAEVVERVLALDERMQTGGITYEDIAKRLGMSVSDVRAVIRFYVDPVARREVVERIERTVTEYEAQEANIGRTIHIIVLDGERVDIRGIIRTVMRDTVFPMYIIEPLTELDLTGSIYDGSDGIAVYDGTHGHDVWTFEEDAR